MTRRLRCSAANARRTKKSALGMPLGFESAVLVDPDAEDAVEDDMVLAESTECWPGGEEQGRASALISLSCSTRTHSRRLVAGCR